MRPVHVGVVLVALAIVRCTDPLPATAQSTDGDRTQRAGPAARDTESGSYVEMQALLEKTIFKVDVLTLIVRLLDAEAQAVRRADVAGDRRDEQRAALAQQAIHARRACAIIEFRRGVSLGQFLNGVDENMRRARDANIITAAEHAMIADELPEAFSFLRDRKIQEGDRILYDIRGDSLTTRYVSVVGELLLEQTDVGPERRLAVLGSYFAPKSEFRKNLLDSYFKTATSN